MVFGASGFQGFQEGVLQGSFMGLLRVAFLALYGL